jgi:caa(3)-type oxidase subunit IV
MSETTHHDHAHAHGGTVRAYVAVFIALCVLTAVSFVANSQVQAGNISALTSFGIIFSVAVVKALLVALIFMHVKWDWSKLYFMILPSFVLAPFLMFALLPDIVLYWKSVAGK